MLEQLKDLFLKEIHLDKDELDSSIDVIVCENPRTDFNFSQLKRNTVILCPLAHGVSAPFRAKRADYWLGDEDGKSRKVNEILQQFREWLEKENLCEEPLDWIRYTREKVRQIISSKGYAGLLKSNRSFLHITSTKDDFEVSDEISVEIEGQKVLIAKRTWQRNAAAEPNGLDAFQSVLETEAILQSLRELEHLIQNKKDINLLFLYVWTSNEMSAFQPSFLRSLIQSILIGPRLFSSVSSQYLLVDELAPNQPAAQTLLTHQESLALSRMMPNIEVHLADAGLPAEELDLDRILSFPIPEYLSQSLERIVPHSATVDTVETASYAIISSIWVGRWENSKEVDGEQIII